MNTPIHRPPEPLLARADLARLLKLSLRTVDRLRAAGTLPRPVRVGSRPRWRPEDIADTLSRLPVR
jgi:predicted DNA-binding transcriptional regulator AlpA